MIQVVDSDGNKVKGLYKKDDGSFVVVDKIGLQKSIAAQSNIRNLNNEVMYLHSRLDEVLEFMKQSKNK